MKQMLITLALLVLVGVALVLRTRAPSTAIHSLASAPEPADETTVVISMLYSPEKQAWIEWAQDQYVRENPRVQVKLLPLESKASIEALLLGQEKPVVWSPESRLELGEAAVRYRAQTGRSLYSASNSFAPVSLVETELVLVAWESRAQVLDAFLRKNGGERPGVWQRLIEAAAAPAGWRALEGPARWGRVKLGYTDPIHANSGLWTLYLACLEAVGAAELTSEQLEDPAVVELLRAASAREEAPLISDSELLQRMGQFGPSHYDMVVVDENLAIGALDIPAERWERLVLVYPPRLAANDHPAVVLDLEGISDEQKAAALGWIRFLRSRPVQLEAIRHGFRPSEPSLRLLETPDDSPFAAHFRQIDERLEGTEKVLPPRGEVVDLLVQRLRDEEAKPRTGSGDFFVLQH